MSSPRLLVLPRVIHLLQRLPSHVWQLWRLQVTVTAVTTPSRVVSAMTKSRPQGTPTAPLALRGGKGAAMGRAGGRAGSDPDGPGARDGGSDPDGPGAGDGGPAPPGTGMEEGLRGEAILPRLFCSRSCAWRCLTRFLLISSPMSGNSILSSSLSMSKANSKNGSSTSSFIVCLKQ